MFKIKSYKHKYTFNFIDELQLDKFNNKKYFFIIDKNVLDLYLHKYEFILPNNVIIITANEETKTLDYCKNIIEELIEKNINKKNIIIAIGGGITQDITSFITSILFRGIDWYFFPTTLLSQCDSCIGSKSSINFSLYKNLLGTFYPPSKIFCYIKFLKTLKHEDIKSGIGEMMHYFIYKNIKIVKEIVCNYNNIFNDTSILLKYIIISLCIKKRIIEKDEFDENIRNIFNYGHTFGHAIETLTNYKINHGQAVTIGMDIANFISWKREMINENYFNKLHNLIKINIPKLDNVDIQEYINILKKDKKNIDDNLTCILFVKNKLQKIKIKFDNNLIQLFELYFTMVEK